VTSTASAPPGGSIGGGVSQESTRSSPESDISQQLLRDIVGLVTRSSRIEQRAAVHAALGDPVRLAIVDELASSDRTPGDLCRRVQVTSNLLAHHVGVLEGVGIVERSRSSGDGRRRYVRLRRDALAGLTLGGVRPVPAMFVCSANSARSQLAAALWCALAGTTASSGGTHPAAEVHPGAIAAAERAGLDVSGRVPCRLPDERHRPPLVVTVCDQAHEELEGPDSWLHWSVDDPVAIGTAHAFDRTVDELRERITALLAGATTAR
jgi:protein-tyrosine-phosphatase/DNA-binding transcriptional ArsR family regulator